MKKIKYIVTSLVITLIFISSHTSCSLDEQLYGEYNTNSFIKSESDIQYVLNGAYATFLKFQSFKSSALSMIMYSSDDLCAPKISGGFSAGLFLTRGYNAEDRYISGAWNSFFEQIMQCNSAIDAINKTSGLNERVVNNALGELHFLRAFSYYYLVRLFGGVPIYDSVLLPTDNFYRPRASIDDVYKLIFEDFKFASENCYLFSEQPSEKFGNATKGAAQAMLSSAYLTYANYLDLADNSSDAVKYYNEAVIYADSVINSKEYALLDNYVELFDVTKEKNAYKEVIFGIQHTRDQSSSGATSRGSELPFYTQPTNRYGVTGDSNNGKGKGEVQVQPWFYDIYQEGDYSDGTTKDYRTQISFLTKWTKDTGNGEMTQYITYPVINSSSDVKRESFPYINKYVDSDGLDSRNHENDLFIIRLSEVYLIKAEALNELGRTNEAYVSFNKLRERARKADGEVRNYPIDLKPGLSKEEFRMAVFNERGLELVGEGHRWFDSVRMRYMDTDMTMLEYRYKIFYPEMASDPSKYKKPFWNNKLQKWNGRVQTLTVTEWNDRYLLFPIPASELLLNKNFGSQNKGW